jgi:surfactin synthase thioesterase subunit
LFEEKFALFGYSMGSLIAYELAHYIKEKQGRDPAHLFVAARRAPHITRHKKALHALPHDKFVQEMLQLGGMSREVFENKELAEIFVPLLRSDLQIVEGYHWAGTREPLNTDITVLAGANDSIPMEHMHAWKQVTKGNCTLSVYPGDHFFIHQQYNRITEQITRVMSDYNV